MCHFMCSRSVFVSQECLNMSVCLFVSLSECPSFSRSADARDVGLVILFSLKSFNGYTEIVLIILSVLIVALLQSVTLLMPLP